MRLSARILGFFVAFFLIIFITKFSFAQTVSPATTQTTNLQQQLTPNTDPNVPNNMHYFTQGLLLEIMAAASCQITGVDPINPSGQCLDANPLTGKLGFSSNGGAIGAVGTLIGDLYVVPIKVGDYVGYLSDNFGVAKKTYAQQPGSGFESLRPVIALWAAFRNISYLVFVIIFLIVGFAIMLRINIDARTVMTIQNQIPKLIIGIVLITFSYAIAGLLVDTMWVANYVVIETLSPYAGQQADRILYQSSLSAPSYVNYALSDNTALINFGGIIGVTVGAANGIGDVIQNMFTPQNNSTFMNAPPSPGNNDCGFNPFCIASDFLTKGIGGLISVVVGGIVSWIVRIAGYLIIGIAILWALIRLWISLIKAYVFILIDVIFAPFWILAGLIPAAGASVGFSAWVKDLLGNLMAFPAAIALFLIGKVIIHGTLQSGAVNSVTAFNPPLIGRALAQTPTGAQDIANLIALGIILMSPNIVNATKKAFKSTGGISFSGGDNLKMGQAVVGGVIGGAAGNYFRRDQYGRAVGAGAVALDTTENRVVKRVARNKFVRGALGWTDETHEGKYKTAREANAQHATQTGGTSGTDTPPIAPKPEPEKTT